MSDGPPHLSLLTDLPELAYYLLIALKMCCQHWPCHSYRLTDERQRQHIRWFSCLLTLVAMESSLLKRGGVTGGAQVISISRGWVGAACPFSLRWPGIGPLVYCLTSGEHGNIDGRL